ncbi:MAG: ATP-dependent helicase/nuclease subunit A [Pirellulaceae bacterium]|jgi:ATP-dependent helicase/nuclease subunit A
MAIQHNSEPRSDAESRELILNRLDVNFMVEASAGTGKTTNIVGRMVNLIARGVCQVNQLVAVTFTRKAAAELRDRFNAELRRACDDVTRTAEEIECLRIALPRIGAVFIGTFHALCSMMLRERPIEAGVDPGFREIDEVEDLKMREDAWRTFIDDLHAKGDGRLDDIEELGLETNQLKGCFENFVNYPDVDEWPAGQDVELDTDALRVEVRTYVDRLEMLSKAFPVERGTDSAMDRFEKIVKRSKDIQWERRGQFYTLVEEFTRKEAGVTQKCWADKKIAKAEKVAWAEFREHVIEPALTKWYQYRYRFIIEILQQAQLELAHLRRAAGGLSFNGLLLQTAEALRENSQLREYFQSRFTHLLVDEFQDTDPVQAEIISFLVSSNHEETEWRKCDLCSGSLFLVGDPKQSIYRFRRADIVTYSQMKQLVLRSDGEVLPLTRTFRTTSKVRNWINEVFSEAFPSSENTYSPAYSLLEEGRPDDTAQLDGVYRLDVPADLRKDESMEWEAEQIARYICNALNEKWTVPRTQRQLQQGMSPAARPDDFMIITKVKEPLQVYARALDRYGVPNVVSGGNAFADSEELQMLIDVLHAVDDPRNPLPYVAVLRGDGLGFSDRELYEIKSHCGRLGYGVPIPTELEPTLKGKLERINSRFSQYMLWLRSLPFPAAAERICSDLGLLAAAVSHVDGNVRCGALLKALEWLRSQSGDFDSAIDMITYLERIATGVEAEGATVLPPAESAVRLINLHKAKGLESQVIFLACAFSKGGGSVKFHVDRSGDKTLGYIGIQRTEGERPRQRTVPIAIPAGWQEKVAEETLFQEGESLRLLYVACTRAASQLVITTNGYDGKSAWQFLTPHLSDAKSLELAQAAEPRPLVSKTTSFGSREETEAKIVASWRRTLASSYDVVAAKTSALESERRPTWQASGDYGHRWGTAIHELLELRIKNKKADLKPIAERLASELELGSERVMEMLAAVGAVAKSDIWQRANESERVLAEVPFECRLADREIPTLVRGVIDLVFKEEDGWVIVDYKTDDVTESNVDEFVSYYGRQLHAYANYWSETLGQPVKERGLFFTRLNRYYTAS